MRDSYTHMTDAIDTYEQVTPLGTFVCKLYQDTDPMSPNDWDNLASIAYSEDVDYNIGNSSLPAASWHSDIRASCKLLGLRRIPYVAVRFEDYGSSGAMLLVEDDPEDANGVFWADPETAAKLGVPPGDERRQLLGEIEVWRQYLQGDVYGYVVESPEGRVLDSCWGFYGYEYAQSEAADALRASVEYELAQRRAMPWLHFLAQL